MNGLEVSEFSKRVYTHIQGIIPHITGRGKLKRREWELKSENQLNATYYFIVLLIGSTYFGRYYAHHQELATIMLITTLVVSFLVCCMLEVRCG